MTTILKDGLKHNESGPAVEYSDGHREYWINGKLHRENGPAIERKNGDKYWYQFGKLHRLDGPAIETSDGNKRYYLKGKEISENNFKANMKNCFIIVTKHANKRLKSRFGVKSFNDVLTYDEFKKMYEQGNGKYVKGELKITVEENKIVTVFKNSFLLKPKILMKFT